jgi:hypothetical protein
VKYIGFETAEMIAVQPLRFRSSGAIPVLKYSFNRLCALSISFQVAFIACEAFKMCCIPSGWGIALGVPLMAAWKAAIAS